MHFLIDMNMPRGWIDVLQASGHRATYWRDVGPASARDEEIMAFARSNGCVVLTRDLDFGDMLALNGSSGPSVVLLRDGDAEPRRSAARVTGAVDHFSSDLKEGALLVISVDRAKLRMLPINRDTQ